MFKPLMLICVLFSVRLVIAQGDTPAPDWLADSQLHFKALPDLLNADSTPTDLGDLRMVINAEHGQLLYQYDEELIQSIPLPTALQKEYATNRITIAIHRPYAIICSVEKRRAILTEKPQQRKTSSYRQALEKRSRLATVSGGLIRESSFTTIITMLPGLLCGVTMRILTLTVKTRMTAR